jgi:hypothetical protein
MYMTLQHTRKGHGRSATLHQFPMSAVLQGQHWTQSTWFQILPPVTCVNALASASPRGYEKPKTLDKVVAAKAAAFTTWKMASPVPLLLLSPIAMHRAM